MFFKKKSKKEQSKCAECGSFISKDFSFCPHCGSTLIDPEHEMKEFGMLGKNDIVNDSAFISPANNPGITDKIIVSLMSNIMKTLTRQFSELEKGEIESFPNGIKIKMAHQRKRKAVQPSFKTRITEDQMRKINSLPRTSAKASVRRLSDKVVYELSTPDLSSTDDVLISKLESGYEIKALGDKKIYVNSIPINLPLHSLLLNDKKLLVVFKPFENN